MSESGPIILHLVEQYHLFHFNMIKPELIIPAGNFEKLTYAIAYGADAGISEASLRTRYGGFDMNRLKEAIDYRHRYKKKLSGCVCRFRPLDSTSDNINGFKHRQVNFQT